MIFISFFGHWRWSENDDLSTIKLRSNGVASKCHFYGYWSAQKLLKSNSIMFESSEIHVMHIRKRNEHFREVEGTRTQRKGQKIGDEQTLTHTHTQCHSNVLIERAHQQGANRRMSIFSSLCNFQDIMLSLSHSLFFSVCQECLFVYLLMCSSRVKNCTVLCFLFLYFPLLSPLPFLAFENTYTLSVHVCIVNIYKYKPTHWHADVENDENNDNEWE